MALDGGERSSSCSGCFVLEERVLPTGTQRTGSWAGSSSSLDVLAKRKRSPSLTRIESCLSLQWLRCPETRSEKVQRTFFAPSWSTTPGQLFEGSKKADEISSRQLPIKLAHWECSELECIAHRNRLSSARQWRLVIQVMWLSQPGSSETHRRCVL